MPELIEKEGHRGSRFGLNLERALFDGIRRMLPVAEQGLPDEADRLPLAIRRRKKSGHGRTAGG
jgi:hypothetical protein